VPGAVESCVWKMSRRLRKNFTGWPHFENRLFRLRESIIESREECNVRSLEVTREESRDFVGQVGR
jgi:hypothetical protein